MAVIDQIRAVSKQRLRDQVGEVSAPELAALEEALREVRPCLHPRGFWDRMNRRVADSKSIGEFK